MDAPTIKTLIDMQKQMQTQIKELNDNLIIKQDRILNSKINPNPYWNPYTRESLRIKKNL